MQHSPPSSPSSPSNSSIPAMNITALKHFIVLSETLHFGRASARSNISTSALSRHIRQLEIELNVSLFDRDNRTVQLTVEGLKFQRYARNAVQQWDRPRTCRQLVPDPQRHTKDRRPSRRERGHRHHGQPGAWGWRGFPRSSSTTAHVPLACAFSTSRPPLPPTTLGCSP